MSQTSAKRRIKLDPSVQLRIGQGLKQMYDRLADAPVPERLLDLLSKLDERARAAQARF